MLAAALLCGHGAALAVVAELQALAARHAQLAPALASSPFGRPLVLQSRQGPDFAAGQVYAELDAGMPQVLALAEPQRWCEVLLLHQTTRGCRVIAGGLGIEVQVGHKPGLSDDAFELRLQFDVAQANADGLAVRLWAERGPLGTRDYDITLRAVPLPGGASFMAFGYRYGYGLLARLAMQSYASTWGQQKIGFTREAPAPGRPPEPVTGMRGVVERNTLRYFLAIDTVLHTLDLPPAQWQQRLERWFAATEQYPRQLREMSLGDYLRLKRPQLGLPP